MEHGQIEGHHPSLRLRHLLRAYEFRSTPTVRTSTTTVHSTDPHHLGHSDTPAGPEDRSTAGIETSELFLRKLGKRIRELRQGKGLRQEDFDDDTALGITTRGVQGIEYGQNNPKIYTLYKIARRLGLDLRDIVDLE